MDGAGSAAGGSGPGITVVCSSTMIGASTPTPAVNGTGTGGTRTSASTSLSPALSTATVAPANNSAGPACLGAGVAVVGNGAAVIQQLPAKSSYSSPWGFTNLANKPEDSTEREARSVALEKAYVHDVYQQIACHFSDSRYRAWPRVKQFLLDLEPGSFVCDVGCGNGKYLSINPSIYKIGLDRCSNLANIAREKDHEVMISDCLALPFRDECFDAGLSIAVIHHFATTERRVAALKELARVLRIGGKLMVSVWAMEQRHRKFESQDVLVPWNRPMTSSSDDKTSSIERDLNSTTTTTSDDDATHYHAYTQTSDSDSFPSIHGARKRGRVRHHRGRSIDPTCPSSSQSSSDLSSPNESCYSFVRRALQKLAGTRRNRGGRRPWFLQGLDIAAAAGTDDIVGAAEQFAYMDCGDEIGLDYNAQQNSRSHHHHRSNDGINNGACGGGASGGASLSLADSFIPIELRQLESTEYADLFQQPAQHNTSSSAQSATSKAALLFTNVLYPRRRRTLETTCGDMGHSSEAQAIGAQPKSKSLSDLLGLLPVSLLRSSNGEPRKKRHHHRSTATSGSEGQSNGDGRERSQISNSLSPLVQTYEDPGLGPYRRHVSVQTEYIEETLPESPTPASSSTFHLMFPQHAQNGGGDPAGKRRGRPMLVKQKHSICSDPEEEDGEEGEKKDSEGRGRRKSRDSENGMTLKIPEIRDEDANESEDHFDTNEKRSPREMPAKKVSPREAEFPAQQQQSSSTTKKLKHQKKSIVPPSSMPFWKQTSMNDELIFSSERLKEKEKLKQQVQKQCSLNEELIYNKGRKGQRPVENNRWDQMKEAFLKNSSNVKCFQLIKNGLSRSFRGGGGSASSNNNADNGDQNGTISSSSSISGTGGGSGVPGTGDLMGQMLPDNVMSGGGVGVTGGPANGDVETNETTLNGDHSQNQNGGGNGGEFYYSQQASQEHQNARFPSSSNGAGTSGGGTTSLRNGIVRMLQNWKQSEEGTTYPPGSPGGHRYSNANSGSSTSARRALFPPFFLRRSSAGSLTLVGKQGNKQDHHNHHLHHHGQCSSPGPLSPLGKGVTGETLDINGATNTTSTAGNKLLPGVRHVRKLSREDGSDSSKDSSFQSDTSVDSEDSFASVIFIPKSGGLDDFGGDFCGTRANSTDSDRSPKSPASRLSPPNHGNLPKSPSPLAQEVQTIMRRRSPEISPAEQSRNLRLTPGGSTTSSGFGSSGGGSGSGEVTKFLFDEATTRLLAGDNDSGASDLTLSQSSSSQAQLSPVAPTNCPSTETEDRGTFSLMQRSLSPPATTSTTTTTMTLPSTSSSSRSSGKKRVEKIEVLRKPGVVPEGKSGYTRQLVRRSLPKSLAVELFNPETDDADTSDTSSSSPNSVSSVVSVVNEDSSAGAGGTTSGGGIDEAKQPIITEEEVDEIDEAEELEQDDIIVGCERGSKQASEECEDLELDDEQQNNVRKSSSASILEVAASVVSSLENLVTNSTSPNARRKSTVSKFGNTSEWLSSLEITQAQVPPSAVDNPVASTTGKRATMKSIKKSGHQKSSTDESLPAGQTETGENPLVATSSVGSTDSATAATGNSLFSGGALSVEMLEERDSLFDSMENLTNNSNNSRQHPSRNPSIDSSVHTCSIRGGDSFDSWTSAKSSLTNSSCTQPPPLGPHKTSLTSMISLPISSGGAGSLGGGSFPTSASASATGSKKMSSLDSNGTNIKYTGAGAIGAAGSSSSSSRRRDAQSRIRVQSSSKSSSAAGEDTEDSTALTCHRYYHVFREGELDKLIEKYVQNLHIISSYYDHANWCIIAEKVQVWTI